MATGPATQSLKVSSPCVPWVIFGWSNDTWLMVHLIQCVVTGDGAVGKVSISLSLSVGGLDLNWCACDSIDMSPNLLYDQRLPWGVHPNRVRALSPVISRFPCLLSRKGKPPVDRYPALITTLRVLWWMVDRLAWVCGILLVRRITIDSDRCPTPRLMSSWSAFPSSARLLSITSRPRYDFHSVERCVLHSMFCTKRDSKRAMANYRSGIPKSSTTLPTSPSSLSEPSWTWEMTERPLTPCALAKWSPSRTSRRWPSPRRSVRTSTSSVRPLPSATSRACSTKRSGMWSITRLHLDFQQLIAFN